MAHIVEEMQLRAEEKWILDALKNVRNQRNCLQIERLQLESLKAKIEKALRQPSGTMATQEPHEQSETSEEMQTEQQEIPSVPDMDDPQASCSIPTEMSFDEQECNQLDLDLDVQRPPVLDQLFNEEYEDSEDDSDDDVILDMDMLMNTPRRKRGAA